MRKQYCVRFNGFVGSLWLDTWRGDYLYRGAARDARLFGSRGEAKRYTRKVWREGKNQHFIKSVDICAVDHSKRLVGFRQYSPEVFCGN